MTTGATVLNGSVEGVLARGKLFQKDGNTPASKCNKMGWQYLGKCALFPWKQQMEHQFKVDAHSWLFGVPRFLPTEPLPKVLLAFAGSISRIPHARAHLPYRRGLQC